MLDSTLDARESFRHLSVFLKSGADVLLISCDDSFRMRSRLSAVTETDRRYEERWD